MPNDAARTTSAPQKIQGKGYAFKQPAAPPEVRRGLLQGGLCAH